MGNPISELNCKDRHNIANSKINPGNEKENVKREFF